MAAPENCLWGASRGKNVYMRGKNFKKCRKYMIFAILSSDGGGGVGAEPPAGGCPLVSPLVTGVVANPSVIFFPDNMKHNQRFIQQYRLYLNVSCKNIKHNVSRSNIKYNVFISVLSTQSPSLDAQERFSFFGIIDPLGAGYFGGTSGKRWRRTLIFFLSFFFIWLGCLEYMFGYVD